MKQVALAIAAAIWMAAPATAKEFPSARGENGEAAIEAKLVTNGRDIQTVLGEKLEEGIVLVEVTITPRGERPLKVWRSEFVLRSDKDGQKSEPYDAGQIAGDTVLELSTTQGGGGIGYDRQGPIWGGMGGDRPRRLGGEPAGIGNAGGVETIAGAQIESSREGRANPLLEALRAKILPEKEITEPLTGLLFYPLEGRHRPAQLWLHYRGGAGKLDLQFRVP